MFGELFFLSLITWGCTTSKNPYVFCSTVKGSLVMLLPDVPGISPIYPRSEWGTLLTDKNFPDLLGFFLFYF